MKYFPPDRSDGIIINHRDSAQNILKEIESTIEKGFDSSFHSPRVANDTKLVQIKEVEGNPMVNLGPDTSTDLLEKKQRILSSRVSAVVEDRDTIYNDAATSFRFALRYSVLSVTSHQRMNQANAFTLRSWLELLGKTLPKEDMSSTLTLSQRLLDDFDKFVAGDSDFISVFLSEIGDSFNWSLSCTRNSSLTGAGYTCGLWHLFHIMTIGLVEWNKAVSIGDRISTINAAIALRNYIEHFFACEECRRNFLQMYDSCGFDHCHLLTGSISVNYDWEQLSLWLFEVHNDIRVRTLAESFFRQGLLEPTRDDKQLVRWPPISKCPECWRDDGSTLLPVSNKLETYNFMQKTLWLDHAITQEPSLNTWTRLSVISFLVLLTMIIIFRTKKRLLHLKAG